MKRIEDVLANLNVKYEIEKDHAFIEFWTDKAGQDIPVDIYYDGTAEDFVEKFTEYTESYDVDDEVECYVNMRGKNGVPDSVRDLIDDCQEAKDTLMEIAESLKAAISGEKPVKNNNNEWHFASNAFMDWVREEFSVPLKNHFTYNLLENTIVWIANRCETAEEFLISITNVVPEVTEEEWKRFL